MEKFLQFLSPLKLPAEILRGMIFIVTMFLSFIPQTLLSKLALSDFVKEHQFYISLLLIISISYYVVQILKSIILWSKNKYDMYSLRKINIENLEKLANKTKRIVYKLYKNGNTGYLEINKPDTGLLEALHIICRASSLSISATTFGYFLQPWVVEYLNQNQEKFLDGIK